MDFHQDQELGRLWKSKISKNLSSRHDKTDRNGDLAAKRSWLNWRKWRLNYQTSLHDQSNMVIEPTFEGFLSHRGTASSHAFIDGIFLDKPSSYWGTPMAMEPPIIHHPNAQSYHLGVQLRLQRAMTMVINTQTLVHTYNIVMINNK